MVGKLGETRQASVLNKSVTKSKSDMMHEEELVRHSLTVDTTVESQQVMKTGSTNTQMEGARGGLMTPPLGQAKAVNLSEKKSRIAQEMGMGSEATLELQNLSDIDLAAVTGPPTKQQ